MFSRKLYQDEIRAQKMNINTDQVVVFQGRIHAGTIIQKSGSGRLYIEGEVDEGVQFNITGMGDVYFKCRPPQSVLDNIQKSGKGEIIMPGGFTSKAIPIPLSQSQLEQYEKELPLKARYSGQCGLFDIPTIIEEPKVIEAVINTYTPATK